MPFRKIRKFNFRNPQFHFFKSLSLQYQGWRFPIWRLQKKGKMELFMKLSLTSSIILPFPPISLSYPHNLPSSPLSLSSPHTLPSPSFLPIILFLLLFPSFPSYFTFSFSFSFFPSYSTFSPLSFLPLILYLRLPFFPS